jgi:hypothetical protein
MNILIFKLIHLPEHDLQVNSTCWTSWSSGYFAQINILTFSLIHPLNMIFRLIYPAEYLYLQTYSRCWTLGSMGHSKQTLIFRLIHPAELYDFQVNPLRCTSWSTGLSTLLNITICGLLSTTEHHALMVTILRCTPLSVGILHIAAQHDFWVTSYSLITILYRELFTDFNRKYYLVTMWAANYCWLLAHICRCLSSCLVHLCVGCV